MRRPCVRRKRLAKQNQETFEGTWMHESNSVGANADDSLAASTGGGSVCASRKRPRVSCAERETNEQVARFNGTG